jgi:6-phosphofructokinase
VVDVCLIPEVKFSVPKLIAYMEKLFEKKGYCVICVAEGAGQDIVAGDPAGTDASGNPILKDIGQYLKDAFKKAIPVWPPTSGTGVRTSLARSISLPIPKPEMGFGKGLAWKGSLVEILHAKRDLWC